MPSWTVQAAQRLDAFLAAEGRTLSRGRAQKLIEGGYVSVNGRVERKSSVALDPGDSVELDDDVPVAQSGITPAALTLPVLYEDDACLVLDKPAGIAVHPGAGMAPGEVTILHGIAHLFQRRKIAFSEDAVLVHRLDRETTGCLLVAKTAAAHLALQKQFEHRTVRKHYLAAVAGVPEHPSALIDSPIGRSVSDRTRMGVRAVSGARPSQTAYRVLSECGDAALVECDLHTGRTHQVRVHLHSIGHPVLGDPTYRTPSGDRVTAEFGIQGLCLHAWKLAFRSPADDAEHELVAVPPKSFYTALDSLGLDRPE